MTDAEKLAKLRELHSPYESRWTDKKMHTMCSHCDTGDPYCTVSMDWPCPTREIIDF
jgi:hypothetical protein